MDSGARTEHVVDLERPSALLLVDVDGDGAEDVVLAGDSNDENVLLALQSRDDGGVGFEPLDPIPVPFAVDRMQIADVLDDGTPTLILEGAPADRIHLVRPFDSESWDVLVDYVVVGVTAGRLNRDDLTDLAVIHEETDQLEIFWNRGEGEYSPGAPP